MCGTVCAPDRDSAQIVLNSFFAEIVVYYLVLEFFGKGFDVKTGGVSEGAAKTHDLLKLLCPVDVYAVLFGCVSHNL